MRWLVVSWRNGGVGGPCGLGVDRCGRSDGILGALGWWGHCWDGCGVPVAFVGGEGVQGGGDDVVGLPLQDDVALRAEVLW